MQVTRHSLEEVCNKALLGENVDLHLVPEEERFSLTVRRVLKVRSLLR